MEALRLCIPTWLEFRSYFRMQIRPITPSRQVPEVDVRFILKPFLACWGFCNPISTRLSTASRETKFFSELAIIAAMSTQNARESPFSILVAGGRCVYTPGCIFSMGSQKNFVFEITYNRNQPISYLSIHLRDTLYISGEGRAAAIYARPYKEGVIYPEYFIGDLGPKKMSSFYQLEDGVTKISVTLTTMSESEVNKIIKHNSRGNKTGPYYAFKITCITKS